MREMKGLFSDPCRSASTFIGSKVWFSDLSYSIFVFLDNEGSFFLILTVRRTSDPSGLRHFRIGEIKTIPDKRFRDPSRLIYFRIGKIGSHTDR